MGAIFKNATITTAATAASSSYDGFLGEFEKSPREPIPFLLPEGGSTPIKLVARCSDLYPRQKLDTRGWALQEFMLSPRLLLFGSDEVLWQCQSVYLQPLHPSSRDYQFITNEKRMPDPVFHPSGSWIRATLEQRVYIWKEIIRDYSSRYFTLSEDRHHAISGIIGELAEVWQDLCLAGHWRGMMIQHLCWSRETDFGSTPWSASTAPTWSWRSFFCAVSVYPLESTNANVIESAVSLLDPKFPLGRLQGGMLVLKAQSLQGYELARYARCQFEITMDQEERIPFQRNEICIKLGRTYKDYWTIGIVLEQVEGGNMRRVGFWKYRTDNEEIRLSWTIALFREWTIT